MKPSPKLSAFAIAGSLGLVLCHSEPFDPPTAAPKCNMSMENTTLENYCAGTAFNASAAYRWICGDKRLGPVKIPTGLPLTPKFERYDRFGGLCPGEFIQTWYNYSEASKWASPQQIGSDANALCAHWPCFPINTTIIKGTLLDWLLPDQHGDDDPLPGLVLSAIGTPFTRRALSPYYLSPESPGDL